MLDIGTYQNLIIKEFVDFGAYLINDKNEKVLLPKKQVPRGANIGDTVNVFLYNDSENRPIATTNKPFLLRNEVARLTVVDINNVGAFLNIGLERDLLLPFSEQIKRVKVGDKVDVLMYVDKSHRLCATMYTKGKNVVNKLKNSVIRTKEYEQNSIKVYKIIKERFKGHIIYTDKNASAAKIKDDFNISKTKFKDAIGKLLKDNKIKITDKGIFTYY